MSTNRIPVIQAPPTTSTSSHNNNRKESTSLAYCIVWSPLGPITWIFPFIGHLGICNSAGIASDFRGPYYVGDDGRMAFGAPTRSLRIPGVDPSNTSNSNIRTNTVNTTEAPSSGNQNTNRKNSTSTKNGEIEALSSNHQHNNNNRSPTVEIHPDAFQEEGDGTADNYQISSKEWDDAIIYANEEYGTRMHNICCDNCHSHVAYALNHMNVHAYGIYKWDMVKLAALLFFKGKFLSWCAIIQQFGPFTIIILLIIFLKK